MSALQKPSFRIKITKCEKLILIVAVIIMACGMSAGNQEAFAAGNRNVLFLHSYHRAEWTEGIMDGYSSVLKGLGGLNIHVEYMDTKKIETAEYFKKLRDIYDIKFAGILFDIIMVSDDNAFHFALRHQKDLFNGAPIVFCGVNRFDDSMIAGRRNVTGVVEKGDFEETLAFAFKVRPGAKTVYVINDRTETSDKNLNEFYRVMKMTYPQTSVKTMSGLSYKELKEAVEALPQDSFAFFIAFWQDATSRIISPEEVRDVLQVSPVPVFGRLDYMVGKGVLGGKCTTGFSQGAAAAALAKKILDGVSAAELPVEKDSPNQFMFDHNELEEHGISASLLPTNSIVVNKPMSFLERNRAFVLTTAVITCVLLAFIALLSVNLTRLRRTSSRLRSREMDLIASRKTLSDILSASPSGIVKIKDRVFEWVNSAMCSITGYSEDELVGHDSRFLYPDEEEYQRIGSVIYREGREESRWVRKDGTIRNVLLQVAQSMEDSYIAIITDITDWKKTREALQESEDLYRNIINKIQDVFYRFDTNGKLTMINPAATKMLNYDSFEEMIGLPMEAFWHDPRDLQRMIEELKKKDRLNDYEALLKRKDGSTFYVSLSTHFFYDDKGNIAGREGILRDITERKQSEAQIGRLVTAIEQAAEDIIITDADGVIEYVNPAFESITGYSRRDAIGSTPSFLKSGVHNKKFYEGLWGTLKSGNIWSGAIINRKKDGTLVHEESTISPLMDSAGNITGYVALKRDVTKQMQLESQLRQSQKMEVIGQLAGGIAHDFNNILSAILGYSNLLQMKIPVNDPIRQYVDHIVTSSGKAAALTQSLLAFSRKQVIDPKPIGVNATVAGMKKILSRIITEDISLKTELSRDELVIMADLVQMDQVLMNLVANARDAMPEGGTVTIRTEEAVFDERSIGKYPEGSPGHYALISVNDTGTGMDAQTKEKLFEPFFTTKEVGKGTGLGLPIVYGIVQQHNGFIHVESVEGVGTTFEIFLPVVEALLEKREDAGHDNPRGHEKVLVAEDNQVLRNLLHTILEQHGYKVFEATDGVDAIARQQEVKADLVIMDVVMPNMNGKEAYDRLKKIDPDTRVLFMSGYTDDIIHQKGILDESLDYIAKPIMPRDLLKKVREMFDRRSEPTS